MPDYIQMAKDDSARISRKVEKADIPLIDKIAILAAMDFIHNLPCHLRTWQSSKVYTECVADCSRNLINVIGKIEEGHKHEQS